MSLESKPYSQMTPTELSGTIGVTLEEAENLLRSWNYSPPSDLDELILYNNRSTRYEYEMRGLNYDFSTGDISQEEYNQKELELNINIFGDGLTR